MSYFPHPEGRRCPQRAPWGRRRQAGGSLGPRTFLVHGILAWPCGTSLSWAQLPERLCRWADRAVHGERCMGHQVLGSCLVPTQAHLPWSSGAACVLCAMTSALQPV